MSIFGTASVARDKRLSHLRRAELNNFGDWKSVGGGISEFRIAFGPGYRVYFDRRGSTVAVLPAGGDKRQEHTGGRHSSRKDHLARVQGRIPPATANKVRAIRLPKEDRSSQMAPRK